MNKQWTDTAWAEYLFWQAQDRRILKKINSLIQDIERNGSAQGIGKLSGQHPTQASRVQAKTRAMGNEQAGRK